MIRHPRLPRCALLLVLTATSLHAQCDTWVAAGSVPGTNGVVSVAKSHDPDGAGPRSPRLVLGGSFTVAHDRLVNGIAAYDPRTGTWEPLGMGMGPSGGAIVGALTTLQNGDLIAGGRFLTAGDVPARSIARWNGTSWAAMGTGLMGTTPNNATVNALTVLANGDLVAAGSFVSAGGVPASNIARWDGTSWMPLGAGVDGEVLALVTLPNGDLIAGGGFGTAGGVPVGRIARWNGTAWSAVGAGFDRWVYALTTLPNGDIVAGGSFIQGDSRQVNRVARWDGITWAPLGSGLNDLVLALTTLPNGDVVAGGWFGGAGSIAASGIARWDGTGWNPLGTGMGWRFSSITIVNALASLPDGSFFAGGRFDRAGSVSANYVASWDGTDWSALSSGATGPSHPVRVAAALPNGDVIVGGEFASAGGVAANGIARRSGTQWTSLGSGLETTSSLVASVKAIASLSNGDVVAGGLFERAGGIAANNIARWDGQNWTPLGSGTDGEVDALVTLQNGDLVAGGRFTLAGGIAVNNVALWNGTNWTSLGVGLSGQVHCLLTLPNGDILAGGSFSVPGFGSMANVARWNGTSWAPVGPGIGFPGLDKVFAIARFPNGDLLAGGKFLTATGAPANCIARWNGSSWLPLGSGFAGVEVYAVAILPNGDVLAGGWFGAAGGVPGVRNIARWNGANWSPVGAGMDDFGFVHALVQLPNGQVVAGGAFFTAGGIASPYIAYDVCLPSYTAIGPGCPGTLGVPGNEIVAQALVGQTFITRFTNLPSSSALAMLGWDDTQSNAGPLPLDLNVIGMPGCFLRVSPDSVLPLAGAGNAATWSLPVPNAPALLGVPFYTQCLTLDPGINLLGATVSDAARGVFGN